MNGTFKSFQINEKVTFLNEKGYGIIRGIDAKGRYIVEDEFGFERTFLVNHLVKIVSTIFSDDALLNTDKEVIHEKIVYQKNKVDWEIDLHIENLLDDHRGMSNFEIVNYQLKAMEKFVRKAQNNRVRKVTIIHGVGEGVLRNEVRRWLKKSPGTLFYDADYTNYGQGATVVELRYNIK
jgi:dsDNA-specific endonuclease/ATPase MutS2